MKITGLQVEPYALSYVNQDFRISRGHIPRADLCIVRLTTDDGTVGWGVAPTGATIVSGETNVGVSTLIEQVFAPLIIGRNPFDIGPIVDEMSRTLPGNNRAKAGVDIALHDLAARLVGVPVSTMLGGSFRSSVAVLKLVSMASPHNMADRARNLVEQGFGHFKLKLGSGLAEDLDRVGAVRSMVGPDVTLTVDLNQAYTPKDAIVLMRELLRFDVKVVEQPVAAEDIEGLGFVRRRTDIRLEVDESVRSAADVLRVISAGAADIVSIKLGKFGGIRNAQRVAAICAAANVEVVIGTNPGGQLMEAANLQFAASLERVGACELGEYLEVSGDPVSGLELVDGALKVPDGPGLGLAPIRRVG